MVSYTSAHWGIYEVGQADGADPVLKPFRDDPNPSPIGLHQLDKGVKRLRVKRPAIRRSWYEHGAGAFPDRRGREGFVEVPWDEALNLVAQELARVKSEAGNTAIFGGSYGWASAGRFHHAQSQIHRFLNTIGGYVRHNDSYSLGAGRVVMPHIVAPMNELMMNHTSWDVMAEATELFVTFGGVPEKNSQVGVGGAGKHRVAAGLNAMARAGTKFVNISPVRDNLDTGCEVEWIPIRPNTDTAMMMALAWVMIAENLADRKFLDRFCVGFDQFEAYVTGQADGIAKDPQWAAQITGVPADRIAALARQMAGSRTMVNVAWALQRASHGEQPFWMVVTLAAILGQIGLPGGGFGVGYGAENSLGSAHPRLRAASLPQGKNAVDSFIPVARITDMLLNPGGSFQYNGATHRYTDNQLIYWAGGNPFHHHQDINRLLTAWQKPKSIIVHEQYWNPLAKFADVVLPATTNLERNDIGYATREGYLVAMKKAMPPVGEARDDYAIFSGLTRRLGVEQAFTEGLDEDGWLRRFYRQTRESWDEAGIELPEYEEFWETGLINMSAADAPVIMFEDFRKDPDLNPLTTPSGKIEIFSQCIAGFALPDCPGHPVWIEPVEWLGKANIDDHPLHLLSDQPKHRLHSQLDASGYSQKGKRNGLEQIYLNPADAHARGINPDDKVEVFNQRGACMASAALSDDIMPGVVRLSTGAWFTPDWETGCEQHGNPNMLTLDIGASSLSQGCSAQTCLVNVRTSVNIRSDITPFTLPKFENSSANADQNRENR